MKYSSRYLAVLVSDWLVVSIRICDIPLDEVNRIFDT
jgi:hypothetical protein